MIIQDYSYKGLDWHFDKISFQNINLIVGDSGTGKTRLLNTIFNLGTSVAQGTLAGDSEWDLSFSIGNSVYYWNVITKKKDNKAFVDYECLKKDDKILVNRDKNKFIFLDVVMPKLPGNQLSLFLLKDEAEIKPIYQGFFRILRRRFFSAEQEKNSAIATLNLDMLDEIGRTQDLEQLYVMDLPLNARLYVLQKNFPVLYKSIIDTFLEAFDYVIDANIFTNIDLGLLNVPINTPVFLIKERNIEKLLRLDELSSGMQKVLIIITDIFSLPPGGIYIIDEYENSLGIGPINLLPDLLLCRQYDIQFFITSHHPYIITKMPISTWYVTHRIGSHVSFDYGEKLIKRYSDSSQDSYFQLVNDKVYSDGIE